MLHPLIAIFVCFSRFWCIWLHYRDSLDSF